MPLEPPESTLKNFVASMHPNYDVSAVPRIARQPLPHRTSIATVCLSGHLPDKLRAIASAGFDGVEIFENDLLQFQGTPFDIYKQCQELNLRIEMFQPFRDFEGAKDENERKKNLARLERKFQWMDELHTDLILLCSSCSPSAHGLERKDRLVQDLRAAAQLAEKYGKRIAYEALAWGENVYLWEQSWDLVKAVDHPRLGLCLDSFHIFSRNCSVSAIANVPAEKIFFVQLADAPILKMDHLSYSRHHRNFPLQGSFDLIGFVKTLVSTGYSGPLSLEVFNDEFRAAPAGRIAADALRSLLFLIAEVYPEKDILPPIPAVERIEFVEFTVDEQRYGRLESFITDLGLKKVARHKSKNVTVYRQGDVSFILNSEPESFANAFLLLHDCSICAIAVRVHEIQATLDRARYLGCPIIYPSKIGDGESHLIAIQAPDDSLIYLVDGDEFWKKDFVFENEMDDVKHTDTMDANPAYGRVDHIAQALDRLSMDRFVLFYKSIFGMVSQQVFELNDPYGLTKSRAMVLENGALRFPLNVSDEKNTNVGRLVREAAGSVIHHVAVDTADIFSTVAAIRANTPNDRILRVPGNYYDDLAVRFDLPSQFVAKLKVSNIMYDRDDKGEFLHCSTEQFEDRFFFEIVQRSEGYAQFASINAPIRMSIHHERRNLQTRIRDTLCNESRGKAYACVEKKVVVVYQASFEEVVDLVADILNSSKSINFEFPALVTGILAPQASTIIPTINRDTCLILNAHNISQGLIDDTISALCDYEYIYTSTLLPGLRQDLTRFLSFILGHIHPHENIMQKGRSSFLTITFPDVNAALPKLDILTVGADAVELRIDLLQESPSYPPSIAYVGEQVMLLRHRTSLPIIFTLRTQSEGGRFPDIDGSCSHPYLKKALQWGCEYVDHEVRFSEWHRKDLVSRKGPSKIIASFHDYTGNMKWSSVVMQKYFHSARATGDIVKLVLFASSLSDNFELEHFRTRVTAAFPSPLLAMNAGQIGQLSRILNTFFTPITHPLLPVLAAPGQLSAAEINAASHILGLMPKKTIYIVGASSSMSFGPLPQFWEKSFNELGLPYNTVTLDRMPPAALDSLLRQPSFGGLFLSTPLPAAAAACAVLSPVSKECGLVDTIAVRAVGDQEIRVGDNAAARALLGTLAKNHTRTAYKGRVALVVASSPDDASSSIWALRQLDIGIIFAVGFQAKGVNTLKSVEDVRGKARPWVTINCLEMKQRHLIRPLLKMIEDGEEADNASEKPRKGVMVDLWNSEQGTEAAESHRWVTYKGPEIAGAAVGEAIEILVGQSVPPGFVRIACRSF